MNVPANLALHQRRPVSIRPISTEGWHAMEGDRPGTHRSATANNIYITGGDGRDAYGPIDFRHRGDLVPAGLESPTNHPNWATEPGLVWRELDVMMRPLPGNAISAWHIVVSRLSRLIDVRP